MIIINALMIDIQSLNFIRLIQCCLERNKFYEIINAFKSQLCNHQVTELPCCARAERPIFRLKNAMKTQVIFLR